MWKIDIYYVYVYFLMKTRSTKRIVYMLRLILLFDSRLSLRSNAVDIYTHLSRTAPSGDVIIMDSKNEEGDFYGRYSSATFRIF